MFASKAVCGRSQKYIVFYCIVFYRSLEAKAVHVLLQSFFSFLNMTKSYQRSAFQILAKIQSFKYLLILAFIFHKINYNLINDIKNTIFQIQFNF